MSSILDGLEPLGLRTSVYMASLDEF